MTASFVSALIFVLIRKPAFVSEHIFMEPKLDFVHFKHFSGFFL